MLFTTTPPPMILPPLAAAPWLAPAVLASADLHGVAADILHRRVDALALVKAFNACNSADAAFASDRPSVAWISTHGMPRPTDERLTDVIEGDDAAPLSARVASSAACDAPPLLRTTLDELAVATRRQWRDADAYLTPGGVGR